MKAVYFIIPVNFIHVCRFSFINVWRTETFLMELVSLTMKVSNAQCPESTGTSILSVSVTKCCGT